MAYNPPQIDTISQTLTAAVANAATYTAAYPSNRDEGSYASVGHKLSVAGALLSSPADFTLTFGTGDITVTNASGASWPAGAVVLELKRSGEAPKSLDTDRARATSTVEVMLGAPDTADVNGVFEAFSGAAGAITLDGALLDGDAVVFDVPRNIVIDSGGADTAVLTFTGTDEYGVTMTEAITLNGTTAVLGNKAFKTITAVTSSATISNGAFAGPGNKLGLPVFVPGAGNIVAESEDGAAATAGTLVGGVTTEATSATGDVRGTYTPNSTPDGGKVFKVFVALNDPTGKGVTQA